MWQMGRRINSLSKRGVKVKGRPERTQTAAINHDAPGSQKSQKEQSQRRGQRPRNACQHCRQQTWSRSTRVSPNGHAGHGQSQRWVVGKIGTFIQNDCRGGTTAGVRQARRAPQLKEGIDPEIGAQKERRAEGR